MDGKYRVCRSSCPKHTPKHLDDSEYIAASALTTDQSQSDTHHDAMQTMATTGEQNRSASTAISTNVNKANNKPLFEIHFEFGKKQPTHEGLTVLKSLLDASKDATNIELLGETDRIGTQIYNDKLAFARAHFVARWLKEHGVKTKISIEAKGMCCLASPYDKKDKTLETMRRVTVHLTVQPKL